MSTSTTGTSTISLSAAETGYQTFSDAGVTDGDVVSYVIEDGDNWEIGRGIYTASGTTLSRGPLESNNNGSAISLSGEAKVFVSSTVNEVYSYATTTINVDQTLDPSVEYETGSGTTIQSNAILTIPVNAQLTVNTYSEKRPLQGYTMGLKLNTASGSITITAEDGSGNANVTIPRSGIIASPVSSGSNGYVLTTDGAGTASWAEASGGLDETTATTTSTTQTAIASYSATTYGSAKLIVSVKRGTDRQMSELLIVHDGTTASSTEYAQIYTSGSLATFEVDISGGNVRLLATASSATSTNYTVKEILVDA